MGASNSHNKESTDEDKLSTQKEPMGIQGGQGKAISTHKRRG